MSTTRVVPTVSVPSDMEGDLGVPQDRADLLVWDMRSAPPARRIDIVVLPYMNERASAHWLSGVETQLVQGQSIGYEGLAEVLPPGVVFANAASVHEAPTAELAIALVLAAQRRLDLFIRQADQRLWAPRSASSLADRRVLLLGYGGVGKAVAARLAHFDVELTVVARRARIEDGLCVHGFDHLPALLPGTEILVSTLPGGTSTRQLVGESVFSVLPDDALVVNVGRGTTIDQQALLRHIRARRLRAALDVTDPEPLPVSHPLWEQPGVLITPHVGGVSTAMRPRIARLVRQQIGRMLAGEPPVNVVLTT